MTTREMFAAFVLDRLVDVPAAGFGEERVRWARERLARAGLELREAAPRYGLDGLPDLSTTWLGVAAAVRVIDSADHRALVLVVSQAEVYRKMTAESAEYPLRGAAEFRDMCDATAPTYAFVQPVPVADIPDFLDEVSAELLGLRLDRLATFGFPLWYVDRAWADLVVPGTAALTEELPARHGVLVLDRDSPARWL